jgi:hypothetical protein
MKRSQQPFVCLWASMFSYRAALPLSRTKLDCLAGVVRRHRKKIGSCWRKLSPGRQALLVLAHPPGQDGSRRRGGDERDRPWRVSAGIASQPMSRLAPSAKDLYCLGCGPATATHIRPICTSWRHGDRHALPAQIGGSACVLPELLYHSA